MCSFFILKDFLIAFVFGSKRFEMTHVRTLCSRLLKSRSSRSFSVSLSRSTKKGTNACCKTGPGRLSGRAGKGFHVGLDFQGRPRPGRPISCFSQLTLRKQHGTSETCKPQIWSKSKRLSQNLKGMEPLHLMQLCSQRIPRKVFF